MTHTPLAHHHALVTGGPEAAGSPDDVRAAVARYLETCP
jgi:hypothetical protein